MKKSLSNRLDLSNLNANPFCMALARELGAKYLVGPRIAGPGVLERFKAYSDVRRGPSANTHSLHLEGTLISVTFDTEDPNELIYVSIGAHKAPAS